MYVAALIGGRGSSGMVEMLLFHDEPPNGTMFVHRGELDAGDLVQRLRGPAA